MLNDLHKCSFVLYIDLLSRSMQGIDIIVFVGHNTTCQAIILLILDT